LQLSFQSQSNVSVQNNVRLIFEIDVHSVNDHYAKAGGLNAAWSSRDSLEYNNLSEMQAAHAGFAVDNRQISVPARFCASKAM
jgi:hypothetical protein